MMNAEVGDDVFGEDPTVNALQERVANYFGFEAALFCPSGTQANQIAINVHTRPGDEVICSSLAHVYLYEGGGIAQNSGCSVRLLPGERGLFTASEVAAQINSRSEDYLAYTSLVCVEDTMNKGGGAVWDITELERIGHVCTTNRLAYHCDGARVWNALAKTGHSPLVYGQLFDSMSVCMSKGMGAPVGSLVMGNEEFITAAHRRRKSMGGGMRQAGMLAAAGLHALEHHLPLLHLDHEHAAMLSAALQDLPFVQHVAPVDTNIVIWQVVSTTTAAAMVDELRAAGIDCFAFGPDKIRFVTHLDVSREEIEMAIERMKNLVV